MSSVQMAADSTQGGYHRKDTHKERRSREKTRKRRSDTSQDRGLKKKKRNKHAKSECDDGSDGGSDLDLSKDLYPIGAYIKKRNEMVDQMFHSISRTKLKAMLPHILKGIAPEQLKQMCVEQVEMMSKKRIVRILQEIANKNSKFRNIFLNYLFNDTKALYTGGDPEAISSTDEDDDSTEAEVDEAEGSTGDISEAASVAADSTGHDQADVDQDLESCDELEDDQGSLTDAAEEPSSPYQDDGNTPNQSRTQSPVAYQPETTEVEECHDQPEISDSGAGVSSPSPLASLVSEKPAQSQPTVIRKVKKKKPARSLEDMEEGEILTDEDMDDDEYEETVSAKNETKQENEKGEGHTEGQVQVGQDLALPRNDATEDVHGSLEDDIPNQTSEQSLHQKNDNSVIHASVNLTTSAIKSDQSSPGKNTPTSVSELDECTQQATKTDSSTADNTKPEVSVVDVEECDDVKQDSVALHGGKTKESVASQIPIEDKEADLTVINKEDNVDQQMIAKSDVVVDIERDNVDQVVSIPVVSKNISQLSKPISQLSKPRQTLIAKKEGNSTKLETGPNDNKLSSQLQTAVVSKQEQVQSLPPEGTVVRQKLAKPKPDQIRTLSKDQMEILELEMRARAIKAMLRTQGANKQAVATQRRLIQRPAKPN